MRYSDLQNFLSTQGPRFAKGTIAIILAEDEVELPSTLRHHIAAGFKTVILLARESISLTEDLEAQIHRVDYPVYEANALENAVDKINAAAEGAWIYYCYNAEYLFFPFCESRNINELLAFHSEERRNAMLTYVIDLYARDLGKFPNAVSLQEAYLDRSGYYTWARSDPDKNWEPKERQLDFFGGIRWRFEEHVPWMRRKIDRISIFRAQKGLKMREGYTFSDEEYNTYACPWHNNLTAAVCSFRTAKALRTNPGSRDQINSFYWTNSVPFSWNSQQLMDLGLMEPGQWF